MKKRKGLWSALVLSFVTSFMLFLYEPVTMYANNINDFWFDFYTMLGPTLVAFAACFVGLMLICGAFFVISLKVKKPKIYDIFIICASVVFLIAYIHGNFLSGMLPALDGTEFNWNDLTPNIISIVVCLVLAAVAVFCCKKFTTEKVLEYVFYVPCVVFAMLFISLITTFTTTAVFEPKEVMASSTLENINTASTDKNFMILLVDAVDAQHFNKIVQSNEEYLATFKDFSYFPDTLSGYAFTRDSIPFIFSGIWNENTEDFAKYSTAAFNDSIFLNRLAELGYDRNFYDPDFTWRDRKVLDFTNVTAAEKNVRVPAFVKQEVKYALFKYLPYPLKRFSSVASMDFSATRNGADNVFYWNNLDFYNDTLEQPISKKSQKYFQYVHIEGGHVPLDLDENVNQIEGGTYPQKLEATMKIIAKYIERLKNYDAYDNSTIVVMADHGFWYDGTDRQNPILYIKGVGETHDKMVTSDKQISYADIAEALTELLDDKNSEEIFAEVPTEGRVRRYLYNGFNEEEHMAEYEQTGKAWDISTFKPTGKEYNL